MKPVSGREREAAIEAMAKADFAHHALTRASDDRWLIQRPGCSFFATEIVALRFRSLLVHGDIDGGLFRSGSYEGARLVHWMANSGLDYLATKVQLGEASTWDPEVALHEVHARAEEITDDREREALMKAGRMIERGGSRERVQQHLYDADVNVEFIANVGEVVSSDIIYAREAVRTLVRLLDAQQKEQP